MQNQVYQINEPIERHAYHLLKQIKQLDGYLWEEEGQLKYRFPAGTLTPDLLQEMKAQKAAILDIMHTVKRKRTKDG